MEDRYIKQLDKKIGKNNRTIKLNKMKPEIDSRRKYNHIKREKELNKNIKSDKYQGLIVHNDDNCNEYYKNEFEIEYNEELLSISSTHWYYESHISYYLYNFF
jgi:hypothetical protein